MAPSRARCPGAQAARRESRERSSHPRSGIAQVDAVVLQGCGQHLVEAGAVLGIGGMGRDQVVLRDGQVALLQSTLAVVEAPRCSFFTSASRLCWL